jgi:hypothetical protein
MKVGDLVTRHPDYEPSAYPPWPGGIVTVTEAAGTHVKVYWPVHGELWCPINRVEVNSESR